MATLFRFLRANFPDLKLGAFLDDRNITSTSEEELLKVLAAIKAFDQTAGHSTNLSQSAVLPTPRTLETQ